MQPIRFAMRCWPLLAIIVASHALVSAGGDIEDKRDKKKVGSVYLVPVGHDSPQNGFGGTRFVDLGNGLMAMVKVSGDAADWRDRGCFFIQFLDQNRRTIRIGAVQNDEGGLSYDLAGQSTNVTFGGGDACVWNRDPIGDQKGGGSYHLRAANGKLKGWYLSFEEKAERRKVRGGINPSSASVWKAKLTPEPGHMSKISFCDTPFQKKAG